MPTILITGATGKQGGAAIDALLNSPDRSQLTIKALTRNTSSPASQALTSRGVQMVKGDLLDKAGLVSILSGVDAAFLMTDFMGAGGVETEVKQGLTFTDAAKEANVSHVVFTSVQSADRAPEVPHFHSKFQVENKLRDSGLKWTILRPAAFMDNVPLTGFGRLGALTFFNSLIGPKHPLQWIAVEDIGKVAAQALLAPNAYAGQIIDLAAEDLTLSQLTDSFKKATGTKPWMFRLPHFLVMAILPYDFKQMVKVSGI